MMRRSVLIILSVAVLFSACKKATNLSGGSWSFKSVNYKLANCSTSDTSGYHVLNAQSSGSSGSSSILSIYFIGDFPDTSGYYRIESPAYPPFFCCPAFKGTAWIVIRASFTNANGTANYVSTGGNTTDQKAAILLVNGKIRISGMNIEMVNTQQPSDSTTITFNVNQQ